MQLVACVAHLNLVQGREQTGNRPVLILSIDTINQMPFLRFQIRSLYPNRLTADAAGKILDQKMLEIEAAVRYCLGL